MPSSAKAGAAERTSAAKTVRVRCMADTPGLAGSYRTKSRAEGLNLASGAKMRRFHRLFCAIRVTITVRSAGAPHEEARSRNHLPVPGIAGTRGLRRGPVRKGGRSDRMGGARRGRDQDRRYL